MKTLITGGTVVTATDTYKADVLIDGSGGRRGPDLTHVAARLSEDRLITRIASGGPGMPDYAAILSKDELANLVAFLETRR